MMELLTLSFSLDNLIRHTPSSSLLYLYTILKTFLIAKEGLHYFSIIIEQIKVQLHKVTIWMWLNIKQTKHIRAFLEEIFETKRASFQDQWVFDDTEPDTMFRYQAKTSQTESKVVCSHWNSKWARCSKICFAYTCFVYLIPSNFFIVYFNL